MSHQAGRAIIWVVTDWRERLPSRSSSDRLIGGVAGGVAAELGIDSVIVRIAFGVMAVTGIGIPVYLVAWLVLPGDGDPGERGQLASSVASNRRIGGLGLIVVGAVLLARDLGIAPRDAITWPILIVAVGVGFVVWQVQPIATGGRGAALRTAAGVVVVALGIGALIAANLSFAVVWNGLLPTVLIVGGLALILGPWIAVLMRDRREERLKRIRADERSEMAAHLHDSVLQTFALMQRADDPAQVSALARRQERELRSWLYGDGGDEAAATLKVAVERIAADVEDRHSVVIDVVVVGDAPLENGLESVVAAAGEAMTNAAKWSGETHISVYVEVVDSQVEVFVRDTGSGFDPESISADRLGVRESIRGRIQRLGGECEIQSGLGEGTEVRLLVQRS